MSLFAYSHIRRSFEDLFLRVTKTSGLKDPNAMVLATSGWVDGRIVPSCRVVLLKEITNTGFVFFTNSYSAKGQQIAQNSNVCLMFYWESLGKQVRINGLASKVDEKKSDEYFASRRRESRIGAIASLQSQVMQYEDEMKDRYEILAKKYEGVGDIVRPKHWCGFEVVPWSVEFWTEGDFRVHDRILYTKIEIDNNDTEVLNWKIENLFP